MKEQFASDRNTIINKQRSLEETNTRLAEQVFISKAALTQDLELNEQQFYDLQVSIPLLSNTFVVVSKSNVVYIW